MVFIRRLIWNEDNIAHIARHNVRPEEVEAVCHSDHIALEGKKGRIILVGPTARGRMVAVILDLEPEGDDVYYVTTARPASRKERAYYAHVKGGVKV